MPRENNPGLKILWLWTIGTAGILVASVVRTRLKDMEQEMNADQQKQGPQQDHQSTLSDQVLLDSDEGVIGEVKS